MAMGKEFCTTRLYWAEYSTQSVWNFSIKFDTWKKHWKLYFIKWKKCYSKWEKVLWENHVNRESEIIELTIYLYMCYNEHEDSSSCSTTVYLSNTHIQINNKYYPGENWLITTKKG